MCLSPTRQPAICSQCVECRTHSGYTYGAFPLYSRTATPEQLQHSVCCSICFRVYCSQKNVTTTNSLAALQSNWICKNFTSSKTPKSTKHPVFKKKADLLLTNITWSANFYEMGSYPHVLVWTQIRVRTNKVEHLALAASSFLFCFIFSFHSSCDRIWHRMTMSAFCELLAPKGKEVSSSSLTVCVCISAGSQPNLQVMPWSPWTIECLSSFHTFCNLIVRLSIMLPFETSVEIWCNIHGLSSNWVLLLMYCFNDEIHTKYSLYLLLQLWHWNVFSFLLTPITACFGTTNEGTRYNQGKEKRGYNLQDCRKNMTLPSRQILHKSRVRKQHEGLIPSWTQPVLHSLSLF